MDGYLFFFEISSVMENYLDVNMCWFWVHGYESMVFNPLFRVHGFKSMVL